MKNVIVGLVLCSASISGFARGGDESARVPARGTQAYLVLESIEHSVRDLLASGVAEASIESAKAETEGTNATVVIGIAGGTSALYNCATVEESSRGGSVIKKDVRCTKAQ
ncbi:MAG: hypothetical protein NT027_18140 [Proteobacteria bacterium]|nr:hypothetical protein [Pseudomonadota bacterium]